MEHEYIDEQKRREVSRGRKLRKAAQTHGGAVEGLLTLIECQCCGKDDLADTMTKIDSGQLLCKECMRYFKET